jgi:hypothetical protein
MTHTPQNLITRNEAAARAGVGPRTIDYWRKHEKITTYWNARGQVRLDPEEIDDLTAFAPKPVPAQRPTA